MRVEHLVHDARDVAHHVERQAGLGVEVDAELVGMVDVGAPHRPRVEVEAAEVDRPHEVGDVDRAELVGGPAARERHPDGLEPLRPLLGTRFWKNGSPSAPSGNA